MDLYSIEYLQSGSERQKRVYGVLREFNILARLTNLAGAEPGFGEAPALVGSLALDLSRDDSEITFATYTTDLRNFGTLLKSEFAEMEEFRSSRGISIGVATLMTSFRAGGELILISTQGILVPRQNAVVHLLVEERLLAIGGPDFRENVWSERKHGRDTERAFGEVLELDEPYRELLALEELSDNELKLRFADKF